MRDEHHAGEQLGGDGQAHQQRISGNAETRAFFAGEQDGRPHRAEVSEAIASGIPAVAAERGDRRRVLAAPCDVWARLPLPVAPGGEWNSSVATDVLGRVVEVVSGQTLDRFFAERILQPLAMSDTGFSVPEADHGRLAALYAVAPGIPGPIRYDLMGDQALKPPTLLSGGGGLVSTIADYHRFAQLLLGRGELDGVRLLSPRTIDLMASNHLPGGADLEAVGRPLFAETTFIGVGFGLGFSVLLDPVVNKTLGNRGEFAWGGAASTAFWVDPVDQVVAIFMTQLLPSSTHPIRSELRQLVYQAILD